MFIKYKGGFNMYQEEFKQLFLKHVGLDTNSSENEGINVLFNQYNQPDIISKTKLIDSLFTDYLSQKVHLMSYVSDKTSVFYKEIKNGILLDISITYRGAVGVVDIANDIPIEVVMNANEINQQELLELMFSEQQELKKDMGDALFLLKKLSNRI